MAKRAVSEGADSFWVKTLAETIGNTRAIDPTKADLLRKEFLNTVLLSQLGKEHPEEISRHAGRILARLFGAPDEPKAAPAPKPDSIDLGAMFDDTGDDLGLGQTQSDSVEDPLLRKDGPFYAALMEWVATRRHPFHKVIEDGGVKYGVVGTCVGKTPKPDKTFNINCTTGNHRKIKDADETTLVHKNGRPISLSHETDNGSCFFVWLLHLKPSLTVRYWINVNEAGRRADDPKGNFRIVFTDGEWKRAA